MRWSKDKVQTIRKVHVDGGQVAMASAQAHRGKTRSKQAAKSSLSA
jgi:hypothetical protein